MMASRNMSRYRNRMSFGEIADKWAAELSGQPNAPSVNEILQALLVAFLCGKFGDEDESRVTMPLVGGETIKGRHFRYQNDRLKPPHQAITRDDFRDGLRQTALQKWAVADFKDLAALPIDRVLDSLLGEGVKLYHIEFADFDAVREYLGFEPPNFWIGDVAGVVSSHPQEIIEPESASRRERRKRETREKYQRWYDIAQDVKAAPNLNHPLKPIEIARKIDRKVRSEDKISSKVAVRGLNPATIQRQLNQHHHGWSTYKIDR